MNSVNLVWYLMAILSLSTCGTLAVSPVIDNTNTLRRELFDERRYNPFNSPLNGSRLEIHLSLLVLHVQDLDESSGTLTTNSWFLAYWNDYRLQWNSKDYGSVQVINAPSHAVWIPEFVLINDVEAMIMRNARDVNIKIFRLGSVFWNAPVNFKTTCYIDHKFYPFDEHSCKISLIIWSMDLWDYELKLDYIDKQHEIELIMNSAIENPLWEITSRKNEINQFFSFDTHFPTFDAEITIRRRSPLFKYILITPGVLSALLTLAIFWLPPTSSAKIGLGGVVMVIQISMLMYLGCRIPAGGKSIPAIVLFCGNTLVMAALTVVISVIVIRISKTSKDAPIPVWIKFLTQQSCKSILCFGPAKFQVWARFVEKFGINTQIKEDVDMIESDDHGADHLPIPVKETNQSDWLLVGAAIDRLCFIIYCFVIGLITIISLS